MQTVLLVDAHPFARKLLGRQLTARGYRVMEAADGEGAIAAYACARPDVVVLDRGLADVDGHAPLELLRLLDPGVRAIVSRLGAQHVLARIGRLLAPVVA